MRFSKIGYAIMTRIALSGLRHSYWVEVINGLLELGEWSRANDGAVLFESKEELYRYINNEILRNSPIDLLEFGVYKGDSIRKWTLLNRDGNSRFFGFDSFEGLPEEWRHFTRSMTRGTFDVRGRIPDIDDPRVRFLKGNFQSILPKFLDAFSPNNRLLIHCDADLYTSTLYALTSLNELMVPGTLIIFDEFSTVNHEFRAFRDYTGAFMRKYKLLAACRPLFSQVAIEME